MILVSFESNYADEFDVFGLKVFENDQAWREYLNEWKEEFKTQISEENTEIEWYFGTNEFIIFNSWSEFKDCFEIVTEDENVIKTLTKTWYSTEKGHFPS